MSQSDAPLALILTQSDIPPEICAHLMLLLHQTLACTRELRSRVERISWHVKGGICLRRDNWTSVRYAEGLNSSKSSTTFQSTDRHDILGQKSASFQLSL